MALVNMVSIGVPSECGIESGPLSSQSAVSARVWEG